MAARDGNGAEIARGSHGSRRRKLVLYFPLLADLERGPPASRDLLPLSLLTIAGPVARDGWEVVLIDGNLHGAAEALRRVLEACDGAFLFATTGILGFQVADAHRATRAVAARHPRLPRVIGGWFASVAPELQLATGLYDAVVLGQGELGFLELVRALEAGEPLDSVAGLALWRDGRTVRTTPRAVVGWEHLPDPPWHLLDLAPYRDAQLAGRPLRESERMVPPPGHARRPWFGISYYSSFGCPERCAFCCSPEVSGLRWKAMPAARMLDDLQGLHERWGFDTVRFYDANFGVSEKRVRELCEGLLSRGLRFGWYPLMQSASIVRYRADTLDLMREAGCYVVQLGAETGDEGTMAELVRKRTAQGENLAAARELDARGVCSLVTYIVGFPGEGEASMHATLDEARRLAASCPLARAAVWPFRPLPGTQLWEAALAAGYVPPADLEAWGDSLEYQFRETWPGQIPARVARRRKLYEHDSTLALGLARGRIGWWERRARRRLAAPSWKGSRLEAKAFDLWRRLGPAVEGEPEVLPGHRTSVEGAREREEAPEPRILAPLDPRPYRWDRSRLVERACPFCGEPGRARCVRPDGLTARACTRCGGWFVSPMPCEEDLLRTYRDYASHHRRRAFAGTLYAAKSGLPTLDEPEELERFLRVRARRRDERLERLRGWVALEGARVLDVGAGIGQLACALAARGARVRAVDVDEDAVRFARERLGLDGYEHGRIDVVDPAERFDVVVLQDVLEHVPEPRALLVAAASRLAPGGILWVATPNAGAALLEREPLFLRSDFEHVQFLAERTLLRLASECALEPVHVEVHGFLGSAEDRAPGERPARAFRLRRALGRLPGAGVARALRHALEGGPPRGHYHLFGLLRRAAGAAGDATPRAPSPGGRPRPG